MIKHDGQEKLKRIKQLKASRLYVVGDNLAGSTDSRHFGWLPRSLVVGKLVKLAVSRPICVIIAKD